MFVCVVCYGGYDGVFVCLFVLCVVVVLMVFVCLCVGVCCVLWWCVSGSRDVLSAACDIECVHERLNIVHHPAFAGYVRKFFRDVSQKEPPFLTHIAYILPCLSLPTDPGSRE